MHGSSPGLLHPCCILMLNLATLGIYRYATQMDAVGSAYRDAVGQMVRAPVCNAPSTQHLAQATRSALRPLA